MSNIRIFAALLFFLLALVFIICFVSQGEMREVKNLVITHNSVLQKAHFELKSGMMENLTSEKKFRKIDNYMAYLYKNKKSLKADIKDIKFESIEIDKDKAVAVTQERWLYNYVDPLTKLPVSEVYDVHYGNTYYLKKTHGRWVVDDLESKEIGGKTED